MSTDANFVLINDDLYSVHKREVEGVMLESHAYCRYNNSTTKFLLRSCTAFSLLYGKYLVIQSANSLRHAYLPTVCFQLFINIQYC